MLGALAIKYSGLSDGFDLVEYEGSQLAGIKPDRQITPVASKPRYGGKVYSTLQQLIIH
jgi:hypothetical protein